MPTCTIDSPLGCITIEGDSKGISSVYFSEDHQLSNSIPDSLQICANQLRLYFSGSLAQFNVKLAPKGTPFQQKVWNELQNIPFGKTKSYQQIANSLGNPKVIRAAASANGKNPIAIIIPCHRVIGSDGSLTGYAGGLHRKKWLLNHESPSKQTELF